MFLFWYLWFFGFGFFGCVGLGVVLIVFVMVILVAGIIPEIGWAFGDFCSCFDVVIFGFVVLCIVLSWCLRTASYSFRVGLV